MIMAEVAGGGGADDTTMSVVKPETVPDDADMVVVPLEYEVAIPLTVMVATPLSDEDQATDDERSLIELSEYIPVAEYWSVSPVSMDWFDGVTSIDIRVSSSADPCPPSLLLHPTRITKRRRVFMMLVMTFPVLKSIFSSSL